MTELVLSPQCRLTKTCLILDPKTTEREWLTIGKTLKTVEKSLQFWVGDWVLFGARRWFIDSDRYDKAEEATGFEHSTLKVFASVAKNVAPLVRTNALSFQHHQLVAPLEPDNQKKWLDLAVENGWSTRQLRDEIRDANKKECHCLKGYTKFCWLTRLGSIPTLASHSLLQHSTKLCRQKKYVRCLSDHLGRRTAHCSFGPRPHRS